MTKSATDHAWFYEDLLLFDNMIALLGEGFRSLTSSIVIHCYGVLIWNHRAFLLMILLGSTELVVLESCKNYHYIT